MMFNVKFSPQFTNAELRLEKSGSFLKINGVPCDFGTLSDGDEIPPEAIDCDWIFGSIKKIDGIVHLTIIMPYNEADAPDHIRFPEPLTLTEDTEIVFNEKVQSDD